MNIQGFEIIFQSEKNEHSCIQIVPIKKDVLKYQVYIMNKNFQIH